MRLLHIIATMNPKSGGPCQGIRNSAPEIEKYGVIREVVSLDDPDDPFLTDDDFIIHALGPMAGPWQYSKKLEPWLLDNMSRFDSVVVNGLWIYPSFAAWSVLRTLKKRAKKNPDIHLPKLFVMPHGMLDPYFQNAPDRRLKAVRNWFYWRLIEKNVVNEADGVLFTCETELLLARKSFNGYHPKNEINVGYGIMPPPAYSKEMVDAFSTQCPQLKGSPYLLFLSRIHKKKGVDLLINAYAELSKEAVLAQVEFPKLVIAGPGIETGYGKQILKLVSSYPHIKEQVVFAGMLIGNAKWGALYGCEAFVLPSHQENFGIAVVEAMACKKTVLISHQINIWREIQAGGGGIVDGDTLMGTKNILRRWLKLTHEEQLKMGENAQSTYQQHFHIAPASIAFIKLISI